MEKMQKIEKIRLPKPDDWHVHLREGALLPITLAASARCFKRCVAMPNLINPITSADQIRDYGRLIKQNLPSNTSLQPLFTLYLTENLSKEELKLALEISDFFAVKWYPAGTTTHSDEGVKNIAKCYELLEAMEEWDVPLLVHGESMSGDVFARERIFIDDELPGLRARFPQLRITLEHISTKEAVAYLKESSTKTAATITPQHLRYNRNHMLATYIKPHLYCKPLLKKEPDRLALCELLANGFKRVFLGSDSAPHARQDKETAHGCAGVFSAPFLLEIYADIFAELGIAHLLADFAARNGANFYNFPLTSEEIELVREPCQVPAKINQNGIELIPLAAGEVLNWSLNA